MKTNGNKTFLGAALAISVLISLTNLGPVWADAAPRVLSDADRIQFRAALKSAQANDWKSAIRNAVRVGTPLARELIQWHDFRRRDTDAQFGDIKAFIDAHHDWPGLSVLQRRAEERLPPGFVGQAAMDWFTRFPPVTGLGKQRLAEALIALGEVARGRDMLRDAWINADFSATDEKAFLKKHKNILTAFDHNDRLDRLLWNEQRSTARRMQRQVDKGHQLLAIARLALMERSGGVDAAIARVPSELVNHPGLIYERVRWRRRAGKDAGARDLLMNLPKDLGRPEKWWREQNYQVREAMDAGLISQAYHLAANNGQIDGWAFAEAEWLAGWLALRFLNEPVIAEGHFSAMYRKVRYPISRARGSYWSGRAAQAAGADDRAISWYQLAARHPTTYYGQLAGQSLQLVSHSLPKNPLVPTQLRTQFESRPLVRATRILGEVEDYDTLQTFVIHLTENVRVPGEHVIITEIGLAYGAPHISIKAAKRASRSGTEVVQNNYPTPFDAADVRRVPDPPELALLLGLARQESEMNPRAISHAGARGLMQLLPGTAKDMTRKLGVPYSKPRLTDDPSYNLMLGSAYLADLLVDYQGAYALALGAYNAGPGRVDKWLRTYGDPRRGELDPIDWIELVPFSETRNYIQRVLESTQVYRHVLTGTSSPKQMRLVQPIFDAAAAQ